MVASPPAPGSAPTARFQILSLDGGGIKGVFSAAFLAAVEDDLRISVCDHFDLIAGTSTGGIIAVGLGLGLRPREIVEFYVEDGPKIFRNQLGWRSVLRWVMRKYSSHPIENALKQRFGRTLFGASSKRLVIPAYNIGEDDVYVFRTPHHERLRRDWKVPAWQVARATSAAPTFFARTKAVEKVRLIDGGVWANNPALVAVAEARGTLGIPLADIRVLSIGTTTQVTNRRRRLDDGGILSWAVGNDVIDILMRGQSMGVNNQLKFLLGSESVERIDPQVASGEFALDGINRVDDLIGKAAHYSRHFVPVFMGKFAEHRASPYSPIYR